MATASGSYSNRPFQINIGVTTMSQSVDGNYSIVRVRVWITKQSYSPSWSNGSSSWSATVNGVTRTGTFTYDFRNSDSLDLVLFDQQIGHNADGTKSFTASIGSTADQLGTANAALAYSLATIPRATQPSLSDAEIDAGTSTVVNLPRASSGFTSTVFINFGNTKIVFANKYNGNSLTVTPPLSLLNQIPKSQSGVGQIGVDTYSGNTLIGTKYVAIRLYAGTNTAPDFDDTTISEANNTIAAAGIVGYIQGVTKLAYSIVGASAQYGASISAYKLTVSGLTSTASSGTTGTITSSGTVTITTTVTDSRGRSVTKTKNINVIPYSPPKLTSVSVQRANAAGAPSPTDGTYARVNINTSITTIKNGSTEQNGMKLRVYSRLKGATTWTLQSTTTPSGLSYNSYVLVGGYPVDSSYEFQVQVADDLSTSLVQFIMPASTIFMHWDGMAGVGIGKFRENGTLDVNGEIYNHQGSIVEPVGIIVDYAYGTAPAGWLVCNGGSVSRATYAALFARIGTTYGAGDGSTTFNVPNLKGRVTVGLDTGQTEFDTVGETGGAKTHTHGSGSLRTLIAWAAAGQIKMSRGGQGASWPVNIQSNSTAVPVSTGSGTDAGGINIDGNTDTGSSLPPYMVMNKIIKT